MTDTIVSRLYGMLTIVRELIRGGQGVIWETDNPRVLVKQFEPALITDDPRQQQDLRHQAETAYKAFCTVTKGHPAELASLPREYLTFRDNPAYLMQKAEGVELQTFFRQKQITPDNRRPLAHALARALCALHSAQFVHADPNPENYIVHQDATGFTVIVLDIDGGGLLSPPGPVYPMSQPKRIYKAPELCALPWEQLHKRFLFFAPDQWALAVLIYQILVDYEGPFCTVKTHPNPTVTNYSPYKPYAYRDQATEWPLPWQEALIRHAKLSDEVVSLFYETFQHRFILNETTETETDSCAMGEGAGQYHCLSSREAHVQSSSTIHAGQERAPIRTRPRDSVCLKRIKRRSRGPGKRSPAPGASHKKAWRWSTGCQLHPPVAQSIRRNRKVTLSRPTRALPTPVSRQENRKEHGHHGNGHPVKKVGDEANGLNEQGGKNSQSGA